MHERGRCAPPGQADPGRERRLPLQSGRLGLRFQRMRTRDVHRWKVTPEEAVRIQEDLRRLVTLRDEFGPIRIVAGLDVSLTRSEGTATGGIVALNFPDLELIETATTTQPIEFPYIPGLLSFRETPVLLAAFDLLAAEPDLLMVDGHGFAHPRRFGIACHIGLLLDIPTVGCAKSRLIGQYEEPGPQPGDSSPLMVGTEIVGSVLRTKAGAKPVFVSQGNRVSLESVERLVLQCTKGQRLPEPTRLAHRLVSQARPDGSAEIRP